eukprot:g2203.t1
MIPDEFKNSLPVKLFLNKAGRFDLRIKVPGILRRRKIVAALLDVDEEGRADMVKPAAVMNALQGAVKIPLGVATGNPLLTGRGMQNLGDASALGTFMAFPWIFKQVLLRSMNRMDADYLREVVKPKVQDFCKNEGSYERTSAKSFLQLPAQRLGAASANAPRILQKRSLNASAPRPADDVFAHQMQVADESDDIFDADPMDDDAVIELEQLTSINLLQYVEKLQAEKTKTVDPGRAAGERSDGTGGDEIEAGAVVPAAWPTVSSSEGGVEDVGRAWKTRWGEAASTAKKGEVDAPGQGPEQAKDLLASPSDVIQIDNEEAIDIEEN